MNNGCLFGFYKGSLYCGLEGTAIEKYKIKNITGNEDVLKNFYGGSWFFIENPKPRILVVGGKSSSGHDIVGKNMMEFKLDKN